LWGQGPTGAQEGSGRVFIWKAAWSSILARPWLGIGYGTYPSVSNSLLLKVPNIDLRIYGPHPGGEPVHNAYLESFVELGILGPILYVGLLVSTAAALARTARRALRANRPHIARIANSLILSLCTWAITSIFLSSETSRGLWIVIGLSLALPKLLPADGASTSRGLALREAVGAA
jgi:O-antigen ligase